MRNMWVDCVAFFYYIVHVAGATFPGNELEQRRFWSQQYSPSQDGFLRARMSAILALFRIALSPFPRLQGRRRRSTSTRAYSLSSWNGVK